eukprot:Seg1549.1 transcript_id=Seg1549.1/GoldUCD/mRNA.D3Y31 product="hypothetical protein" protein_id=Seg1549.1/GoldUCD/D3Y31
MYDTIARTSLITGLGLLFLGGLLAVLSTTTAYWQTVETETKDPTAVWVHPISSWVDKITYKSNHMGLFKACVTESEKTGNETRIYGLEKCIFFTTMSSLTIFCIVAVAVYKKFLLYQIPMNGKAPKDWEKSPFAPKLGWSFHLACVAPALLLASSALFAFFWKYIS